MDIGRLVEDWVGAYVTAWNSNDSEQIAALFTESAAYSPAPYSQAWRGRDAIVREWLARADRPGETEFDWHFVGSDGDLAVVQGTARYPGRTYSNLWLLRLTDEGRCSEFAEWWMRHPKGR